MAYVIKKGKSDVVLPYLPIKGVIKNNREVILDRYVDEDEAEVHAILAYIVNEEGNSYPHEDMTHVEDFRAYYLSHDVFVCKDASSGQVLGSFYIKPNFPGRCSHICNAGFIVKKEMRNQGVGSFLVPHYLQLARDLGYSASFFNLVFTCNHRSVALWRKFNFQEIGIVPKAGNLKGLGFVDAIQFYYDLTQLKKLT